MGQGVGKLAWVRQTGPLDAGFTGSRRQLVRVAIASIAITVLRHGLRLVQLPHDREYGAVVFLMWPRDRLGYELAAAGVVALDVVSVVLPIALLCMAVMTPAGTRAARRSVHAASQYALVLPVLAFVATTLSRLVSNGIYASAEGVTANFTASLALLERPLIEALQSALYSELLSHVCAAIYAGGWFVSLLAGVPLLILRRCPAAAVHLMVGWFLSALLAVPFFLLLPVFEPWTTNPLYGHSAQVTSNIRFLASESALPQLRDIAVSLRWATGSCVPSLHVAIPTLASAVCFQHGIRPAGWYYLLLSALVGFSVIYLGRHWIADVVAGVVFALVVARATVLPTQYLLSSANGPG